MNTAQEFEDKAIELTNIYNLEVISLKKDIKQQIENFVGTKKQIAAEEERLKELLVLEKRKLRDTFNAKKRDLNNKFKEYLEEQEEIQDKAEHLKHKLFNLAWNYGDKCYYQVEVYYYEMSELLK